MNCREKVLFFYFFPLKAPFSRSAVSKMLARLRSLKQALDEGLIDAADYESTKRNILVKHSELSPSKPDMSVVAGAVSGMGKTIASALSSALFVVLEK